MSVVRPPTINLARRPFRNNSVYYGVFITCFVLLSVASGYNVFDFVRTGRRMDSLEQEKAERETRYLALHDEVEKMKKEVSGLDLTTLNAKSTFANGLILSRLFSWSTLFDRMEDLVPPNVRIRSIRPSISTVGIEIQIDGMARAPDDLYQFEQALVSSDYFSGVYPVSENSKESRGEINFDIAMNYVPGGKTQSATASNKLPATPTEGLPQPEASAGPEGSQPADGTAGAGVTPGPPASTAATPSSAPAVLPPTPAPAQNDGATGQVEEDSAKHASKPLPELTNKEFIDQLGADRFNRARGRLKPVSALKEPELTNEEFIKKYGMEEFIKTRGALTREQMNVTPAGQDRKPGNS